jgi:hypothetical protein
MSCRSRPGPFFFLPLAGVHPHSFPANKKSLFPFHNESDFHIGTVFDNPVVLYFCRAPFYINTRDIPDGLGCCFYGICGCLFPAVG